MDANRRKIIIDEIPTEYLPFEVGSIHLDGEGKVTVRPGDAAVRFRFEFDEVRFSAVAQRSEERGILRICGVLGALPYSAESVPARHAALEAMRAASPEAANRFHLSDDQSILVLGNLEVPLPFTHVKLVAHLVVGLLALRPSLERVKEALATLRPAPRANAA